MRRHGYKILFAGALVLLVAMSAWWTALLHSTIRQERSVALGQLELERRLALLEGGQSDETGRSEQAIEERYERRILMVTGEGVLLFLLVGVCIVMLGRMIAVERREVRHTRAFVSTVTHEMKTPLAGIKTLFETARDGRLPDEEARRYMEMGLGEAERLEHMIENVLAMGRLRTAREPASMVLEPLVRILEPWVRRRRGFLAEGQSIELDLGDDGDVEVLVDPDGARIILDNLVDNAFKYGGENPEVRISARIEDGRPRIDVSDRGEGFDPGQTERLFEPFARAMSGTGGTKHGTGLGLGIARALARRMGGDLEARSEGEGRGSTFTFWLPGRPA